MFDSAVDAFWSEARFFSQSCNSLFLQLKNRFFVAGASFLTFFFMFFGPRTTAATATKMTTTAREIPLRAVTWSTAE